MVWRDKFIGYLYRLKDKDKDSMLSFCFPDYDKRYDYVIFNNVDGKDELIFTYANPLLCEDGERELIIKKFEEKLRHNYPKKTDEEIIKTLIKKYEIKNVCYKEKVINGKEN